MKVKLGEEIAHQEKDISCEIQNGYVEFEKEIIDKQKENMKNLLAWFRDIPLMSIMMNSLAMVMKISIRKNWKHFVRNLRSNSYKYA